MNERLIPILAKKFMTFFDNLDKENCVQLALSCLQNKSIDVVTLYTGILTPALYADFCGIDGIECKQISIWNEHIRTSIIRTIIECCYPFVIKERDEKYRAGLTSKVIVLCPPGELHELGPRMVTDFFTLCGFSATFTGANMPQAEILDAIENIQPQYVAISITNYYNLVAAEQAIDKINLLENKSHFKIIIGGQACQTNVDFCKPMKCDFILQTFEDIRHLSEGTTDVTS
jgi:MerR family transcriptional regulator, light-induced transcriptional regulator